jgi:hypothetical protein
VSSRLSPRIDKSAIADGKVDLLVQGDRVPISRLVALIRLHQRLIVRIFMPLLSASGQTKICQLDMTTTVQKDIVGFDVTTDISLILPLSDLLTGEESRACEQLR